MKKIDDPLQNDFGTLSQKTGLNSIDEGIEIGNSKINSIFWADDIVLLSRP